MTQETSSDLEARLRQWEQIPYWAHLGIKVVEGRKAYAKLSMVFSDAMRSRNPELMHGGALASLVDAAVGAAVATLQEPDDPTWGGQATLDINVSFLSAVRGGTVYAEGTLIRYSRTVCFGDVDVRDDAGQLVAKGRATYMIVRRQA